MAEPTRPLSRRYHAFISYRHLDNREKDRRWARWLHDRLEGYSIPRDLVRLRRTEGDMEFPESLYPVFRDEKELRPGADLGKLIADAIGRSDTLIVLCTPSSAQSPWMRDEIIAFKKRGMADRIIVVVIDGVPGSIARWKAECAGDPTRECLPFVLRYGKPVTTPASDGGRSVDWRQPFQESLRIDLRDPETGGQGFTSASAYRAAIERADKDQAPTTKRSQRQLQVAEDEYAGRLHDAVLKIIAGILRVDLGELTRRDLAARNHRLKRNLALSTAVAAVVACLLMAAVYQSVRRGQLLREASRADSTRAQQLLREHQWSDAMAYLVRSLHYWPENPAAAGQLWLCLRYGRAASCPVPEASVTLPGYANELRWSPSGRFLLATGPGPGLWLIDRTKHQAISPAEAVPPLDDWTPLFSGDETRLVVTTRQGRWLSFNREPFHLLDSEGATENTGPAWSLPVCCPTDGSLYLLLADDSHGTRLRPVDPAGGGEVLLGARSFPLSAAAWHPHSALLAVTTGERTFALFHPKTGARLRDDVQVPLPIVSCSYDPTGNYLLCYYANQEGDGWAIVKTQPPYEVVQQGTSRGAPVWLPADGALLVASRVIGVSRVRPPNFSEPERIMFDSLDNRFYGNAVHLPRLLLEPETGRFEVFDLRGNWRLAPNVALPVPIVSPILDPDGRYVASLWTPDFLGENLIENLKAKSTLGFWVMPVALPGKFDDPPNHSTGAPILSPDRCWRIEVETDHRKDRPLRIAHLQHGKEDWALEFEERDIEGAYWQEASNVLAVPWNLGRIRHLLWPPPSRSEDAIVKFATCIAGKHFAADGSLITLSVEEQARWREELRLASPDDPRWQELRRWWLLDRPSE